MVVLREYQNDVIDRCSQRYAAGFRRVICQGATGCGKTTISSKIVERAVERKKQVLFLAHRRRLITQKSNRLREFGVPHGIIMARESAWDDAPVQVASRDTLLSRGTGFDPDLVIVDECHNAMAEMYQELLGRWPAARFLGLTATPARADGKGLAPWWQALECTVPTSRLVEDGFLVPVRCFAPPSAQKGRRKLSGDPVSHWKRHAEGRPTIAFCSKVATSLGMVAEFVKAGVKAEHIDADTPDEEREAVVQRVKSGETKVLANVGVFTEGTDIPELSCCILFRMAGSYVLFAQMVGRIMRPAAGKKDAILLDHSGAVTKHGFPDEDVRWELDEGESVDKRIKEEKEAGHRKDPLCCPSCGCLYADSAACPACGYRVKKKIKEDVRREELLEELKRGGLFPEVEAERQRMEKARFWKRTLGQMAHVGRSIASAASIFKREFGVWPGPECGDLPHGDQWRCKVTDFYPQYLRR